MRKYLSYSVFCLALFVSSSVFASFGINPVVINFSKHERATSVNFKNNDDTESVFQATTIRKTDKKDEKGNFIYERCDVVDASPLKFTSRPNTAQDIRVRLKVKEGYEGDCTLSISELSRKHKRKKKNGEEEETEEITGAIDFFRGFNLPIRYKAE